MGWDLWVVMVVGTVAFWAVVLAGIRALFPPRSSDPPGMISSDRRTSPPSGGTDDWHVPTDAAARRPQPGRRLGRLLRRASGSRQPLNR